MDLVQAIIQILQPLAGPKVGEAVRKTVNELFGVFCQSMSAAFQKFMRPDGTFPPRLGKPLGAAIPHYCLCRNHQTSRDEGGNKFMHCRTPAHLTAYLHGRSVLCQ